MSPKLSPEHNTDSRECWCRPEILQPCPENCTNGADCWRCGGRGVVAEFDADAPLIIVHHEVKLGDISHAD